jgi:2-oxoglutarate dehydrogenase E1 component
MGAYSFINELQLSKMETGVIEAYSASASGSSTRAKRRMADAQYEWLRFI